MSRLLIFFLVFCGICGTTLGQDILTLQEAIQQALLSNYSIQIVRNNQQIAENNNTFGNAGFLPRLDARFSDTENKYSQELLRADDSVVEGDGLRSDNLSAGIALDWTVFDGFSMFVTRDRLAQEERSAGLQTAAAVASLVADVTSSYYAIIQQEKLTEVTRQAMDLSRRRKEISDAKIRIGSGSRLMLLQSQVDYNADSSLLIQRIVETEKAKAVLNRILGRDIRTEFRVTEKVEIDKTLTYDGLLVQMKSQNPDLRVAEINQKIAELDIKEFKSQFYPQVNLFGSYDYSRNNFPAGFSFVQNSTRNGITFGFGISWNLFNGTYISPNFQTAKIQKVNSELQYKENEILLSDQLFQAYKDYQANLQLVDLESSNLLLAQENVSIALDQYQLGVINDIDLRAIQLKQVESETNLLIAQFLAKQSEIGLRLISGTLTAE